MVSKKVLEKFYSQVATLEIVVDRLDRAIKLLKCQKIKFNTEIDEREKFIIEDALTYYIVVGLASLFDNKDKRVISLEKISARFKKDFPQNFFSEYVVDIESFKNSHKKDLDRIEKNRHLMMAHLSGGKERLGYDQSTGQRISNIFGTRPNIALEDKYLFITPISIFKMAIIDAVGEIKKILGELELKRLNILKIKHN